MLTTSAALPVNATQEHYQQQYQQQQARAHLSGTAAPALSNTGAGSCSTGAGTVAMVGGGASGSNSTVIESPLCDRAMNALIAAHLRSKGYLKALSVFIPESRTQELGPHSLSETDIVKVLDIVPVTSSAASKEALTAAAAGHLDPDHVGGSQAVPVLTPAQSFILSNLSPSQQQQQHQQQQQQQQSSGSSLLTVICKSFSAQPAAPTVTTTVSTSTDDLLTLLPPAGSLETRLRQLSERAEATLQQQKAAADGDNSDTGANFELRLLRLQRELSAKADAEVAARVANIERTKLAAAAAEARLDFNKQLAHLRRELESDKAAELTKAREAHNRSMDELAQLRRQHEHERFLERSSLSEARAASLRREEDARQRSDEAERALRTEKIALEKTRAVLEQERATLANERAALAAAVSDARAGGRAEAEIEAAEARARAGVASRELAQVLAQRDGLLLEVKSLGDRCAELSQDISAERGRVREAIAALENSKLEVDDLRAQLTPLKTRFAAEVKAAAEIATATADAAAARAVMATEAAHRNEVTRAREDGRAEARAAADEAAGKASERARAAEEKVQRLQAALNEAMQQLQSQMNTAVPPLVAAGVNRNSLYAQQHPLYGSGADASNAVTGAQHPHTQASLQRYSRSAVKKQHQQQPQQQLRSVFDADTSASAETDFSVDEVTPPAAEVKPPPASRMDDAVAAVVLTSPLLSRTTNANTNANAHSTHNAKTVDAAAAAAAGAFFPPSTPPPRAPFSSESGAAANSSNAAGTNKASATMAVTAATTPDYLVSAHSQAAALSSSRYTLAPALSTIAAAAVAADARVAAAAIRGPALAAAKAEAAEGLARSVLMAAPMNGGVVSHTAATTAAANAAATAAANASGHAGDMCSEGRLAVPAGWFAAIVNQTVQNAVPPNNNNNLPYNAQGYFQQQQYQQQQYPYAQQQGPYLQQQQPHYPQQQQL